MFSELSKRVQKVGQPPGTAVYTGKRGSKDTQIRVLTYTLQDFHETTGKTLEEALPENKAQGITWIRIDGLHDVALIEQLAEKYNIHPLTIEDILNVEQRPKVEEFEGYIFITLKMLVWDDKADVFSTEQISFILGHDFLLSFQERENTHFQNIHERLRTLTNQRMRQQGSDYLAYRLMDTIVDYYFIVLEKIGDQIEKIEELIVADPQPKNTRTIYKLKQQLMVLRKAIWPMREAVSHLSQMDESMITPFTRVYFRDLYDHIVQAIDTIETFRDILASMLDMYLSSLTNRMNEIMKTLTIIATIFIPITFIASLYGMNFVYMPELQWHWGYFGVLGVMMVVVLIMLNYFRKKKWIGGGGRAERAH